MSSMNIQIGHVARHTPKGAGALSDRPSVRAAKESPIGGEAAQ